MQSEQSRKRDENRYKLLRSLQLHGPQRRREVGLGCEIRLSSVTSLVEELFAVGILTNQDIERPRSPLVFTDDKWFAVAIQVAGGTLNSALVGLDGTIVQQRTTEFSVTSYFQLLDILMTEVNELGSSAAGEILGIGLALPGIVDAKLGVWHYAVKFPEIRHVEIKNDLNTRTGLPVSVDNDVRCSLWAGIWFEQLLAKYENAVYLSITEGVNSALLLNSEMYQGASFAAGEIGHVKAGDGGLPCSCGKSDCLESYCSIPAIISRVGEITPGQPSVADSVGLAQACGNDQAVAEVMENAVQRLCQTLSPLIAYTDPQVILLGNQAAEFYEAILPSIKRHLIVPAAGEKVRSIPVEIVRGESPVIRGAAALVMNMIFRGEAPGWFARWNRTVL